MIMCHVNYVFILIFNGIKNVFVKASVQITFILEFSFFGLLVCRWGYVIRSRDKTEIAI